MRRGTRTVCSSLQSAGRCTWLYTFRRLRVDVRQLASSHSEKRAYTFVGPCISCKSACTLPQHQPRTRLVLNTRATLSPSVPLSVVSRAMQLRCARAMRWTCTVPSRQKTAPRHTKQHWMHASNVPCDGYILALTLPHLAGALATGQHARSLVALQAPHTPSMYHPRVRAAQHIDHPARTSCSRQQAQQPRRPRRCLAAMSVLLPGEHCSRPQSIRCAFS